MKQLILMLFVLLLINCDNNENKSTIEKTEDKLEKTPVLNRIEANRLAQLPLHCMATEYPNKLNQTIGDASDLKSPKELHPAFYGCFDWHSAVHGHWSLVSLLKEFPELNNKEEIEEKLLKNMSKENIEQELLYFDGKHNKSFERTYGWAWLLKLAEALHTWDDPTARALETNLQPLTDLIISKYIQRKKQ